MLYILKVFIFFKRLFSIQAWAPGSDSAFENTSVRECHPEIFPNAAIFIEKHEVFAAFCDVKSEVSLIYLARDQSKAFLVGPGKV